MTDVKRATFVGVSRPPAWTLGDGARCPGHGRHAACAAPFASEAYARSKDLLLVQRWLGHTDSKTTLGYIDIDQDHATIRALTLVA